MSTDEKKSSVNWGYALSTLSVIWGLWLAPAGTILAGFGVVTWVSTLLFIVITPLMPHNKGKRADSIGYLWTAYLIGTALTVAAWLAVLAAIGQILPLDLASKISLLGAAGIMWLANKGHHAFVFNRKRG